MAQFVSSLAAQEYSPAQPIWRLLHLRFGYLACTTCAPNPPLATVAARAPGISSPNTGRALRDVPAASQVTLTQSKAVERR